MDTNQTTVKTTTDTLNQDNNNPTKTADSSESTVSTINNTVPGASVNTANNNASTASNNTTSDVSVNSASNASANSANTTSNNANASTVSTASITSNTAKPANEHEGKAILWAFIANMVIFLIKFIAATITKSASMIESSGATPASSGMWLANTS